MADKYDAFLDAPDVAAPAAIQPAPVDKYDAFLDTPVAPPPVVRPPISPVQQPVAAPVNAGYKPTIFEEATGAITEPLMKMGSSLIAKPVSEVAGIAAMFSDYLGGKDGDPMGFKQSVQESLTYKPRTTAGSSNYNPLNAIPNAIGSAMSAVGAPVKQFLKGDASDLSARGMATNAVAEAVPQALGMVGVKNAPLVSNAVRTVGKETVSDAVKSAAFSKQAAKESASAADWQRAAQIEAAKVARENKIVLNPSSVAESPKTIRMAVAGGSQHFNTAASIANKTKWNDMVRADLGIPLTGELSQLTAGTYDAVRKRIAKPYDDAASLGQLKPNSDILTAIREIDIPEILPAGEAAAGKMAKATDYVATQIENGMTGKMALDTTRTLRREAKQVFDSVKSGNKVSPVEIDAAKAKMRMAEKVDELISSNITDPKWKSSFDDSRRKMALTYAYERATNLAKRQIDPQVFAQEMEGRHYLTGNAKKMGEIAANYPEIANVYAERGTTFSMPVRSGVSGTAGFAIGSLYGSPVATSTLMAAAASVGEKLYGKRLRSEAGQAKYATPVDRRVMPEQAPTNMPQRGVVPYVSPTEVIGDVPNFTFGKPEQPTRGGATFVGEDMGTPRIGMSQGPVGGQTGALRAEDARVRDLSMRQGRAAEQAAAAAEAATPRKPASGGMMFDLDPVTGKLRAADQGVKGATPEVWQADTGANLKSASEKVAYGQTFKMTAAEKVAWGKTSVDIKSVSPEFSKLSDKQIMSKMQDREWVQGTIDKANQRAEMFAQIEKQSQDRLAQSMARIQREKMLDIAEQLQDALGSRPSSRGYTQGSKTRDFQRGMLTDLGEPK